MSIHLSVTLDETQTVIETTDRQELVVVAQTVTPDLVLQDRVFLLLKDKQVIQIGAARINESVGFDTIVTLTVPTDIELQYAVRGIQQELSESNPKIEAPAVPVPSNLQEPVQAWLTTVTLILTRFGYQLTPAVVTKPKGKPRHRWERSLSTVPFYINSRGAKATVYWQKRNEMLVKRGASLLPAAPLNKEGSLGFSARFAEKLRAEHAESIQNFQTTQDVVLKSVNEVGLFLYFGGTNGWLELKNDTGETIHELTVVQ